MSRETKHCVQFNKCQFKSSCELEDIYSLYIYMHCINSTLCTLKVSKVFINKMCNYSVSTWKPYKKISPHLSPIMD